MELRMKLKSGPSEKFLADICTSALLTALKINLLYPKKADGQAVRSAEAQKSDRQFSHVCLISAAMMN